MGQIMSWLFSQLSYFINCMLSWKIWDEFSLLHFILGLSFLGLLLSFFAFGESHIGSTSEYIGGIRRHRNSENRSDRAIYINKTTGEVRRK